VIGPWPAERSPIKTRRRFDQGEALPPDQVGVRNLEIGQFGKPPKDGYPNPVLTPPCFSDTGCGPEPRQPILDAREPVEPHARLWVVISIFLHGRKPPGPKRNHPYFGWGIWVSVATNSGAIPGGLLQEVCREMMYI
jgi:hypothetical protein